MGNFFRCCMSRGEGGVVANDLRDKKKQVPRFAPFEAQGKRNDGSRAMAALSVASTVIGRGCDRSRPYSLGGDFSRLALRVRWPADG